MLQADVQTAAARMAIFPLTRPVSPYDSALEATAGSMWPRVQSRPQGRQVPGADGFHREDHAGLLVRRGGRVAEGTDCASALFLLTKTDADRGVRLSTQIGGP